MFALLAHHAESWLGLDIDINGEPFPGGALDHTLVVLGAVLMAYGAFAILRDVIRLLRRSPAAAR